MTERSGRWLLAILLFGLFVRSLLLFVWQPVLSRDSVGYIAIARHFSQGEWRQAIKGGYPPGYPLVIALFLRLGLPEELSAQLASLAMGGLFVLFFGLTFLPFHRRWAFWAGLFASVQPYLVRYSLKAVSEMTFLAAVGGAICCFVHYLHRRKPYWLLGASLAVVFAYLTRPEGLVWLLALSFGLFTFLPTWRERGKALLTLWSLSLLLLLPFLWHLNRSGGLKSLRLTQKPGMYRALEGFLVEKTPQGVWHWTFRPKGALPLAKRFLQNLWKNGLRLLELFHPLFLLVLGGLFLRKLPPPWQQLVWLFGLTALAQLFLVSLVRKDPRLVLQPMATICFLVPLGGYALWRHFPKVRSYSLELWVLLFLVTLPIGLRPMDQKVRAVREAGLWLQRRVGKRVGLVSHDIRVAFYAKARFIHLGLIKRHPSPEARERYFLNLFSIAESYRARWMALRSHFLPERSAVGQWQRVRTFGKGTTWEISLWYRKRDY